MIYRQLPLIELPVPAKPKYAAESGAQPQDRSRLKAYL